MGDVVDIFTDKFKIADSSRDSTSAEDFLLEEGLDFLALYKAIPDKDVRLSLWPLMKALGEAARKRP